MLGRGGGPDDADVAAQLDVRQRLVDQPLDLRAPPRALHLAGQDKAVFPAGQRDALLAQAREAYERAALLDPAYPDPFRQLGFLYYQSKENDKAMEAFRKYLALRPDAPDARRVEEYVVELDR